MQQKYKIFYFYDVYVASPDATHFPTLTAFLSFRNDTLMYLSIKKSQIEKIL